MEITTVRDIMMGAPVTLRPDDTLHMASDIMSLGRIRHIPVVEDGRLVGILSQRDLFGAAVDTVLKLKPGEQRKLLKSFRIDQVMHKRVISAAPDTAVTEAARLMAEKKIGCLPIVEGGELIGLVTSTNILRYLAQ
jgi:CBS domain-containing protein